MLVSYRYDDLSGRTAMVTGASGHLGSAMARALAAQGCRVAVVGRSNRAAVEGVVADIDSAGGKAAAFCADLTDESAIRALFRAAEAALGPVAILVNNAGGWSGRPAPLAEQRLGDWRRVLSDNLDTAFLCSRAAAPGMIAAGWGRVINVSSIFGRAGNPRAGLGYSVAKAGIIALTRQLAIELGPHGVTVNAIAPGSTPNPERPFPPPEVDAAMAHELPLQRLGVPDDHAAAVCFLASGAASWITGATLDVSGGRVMT